MRLLISAILKKLLKTEIICIIEMILKIYIYMCAYSDQQKVRVER